MCKYVWVCTSDKTLDTECFWSADSTLTVGELDTGCTGDVDACCKSWLNPETREPRCAAKMGFTPRVLHNINVRI